MSAGTSVTESSAAAAIAKVLVSASGRNSRPSWSSSVKTGRNDSVMMRSDMDSAGPTSPAAANTRPQVGRPGPCARGLGRCRGIATRERGRDLGNPLLHAVDHAQRILAITHDYNSAHCFAFAVALSDPEPQVGPDRHPGHIGDAHRAPVLPDAHRDLPDVPDSTEVAKPADRVVRARNFHRA